MRPFLAPTSSVPLASRRAGQALEAPAGKLSSFGSRRLRNDAPPEA